MLTPKKPSPLRVRAIGYNPMFPLLRHQVCCASRFSTSREAIRGVTLSVAESSDVSANPKGSSECKAQAVEMLTVDIRDRSR